MDDPPFPHLAMQRKGVIVMNRKLKSYYFYRLQLEKTKQRKWVLIVLSRTLLLLAALVTYWSRN